MRILGVRVDDISMDEALVRIRDFLNDGQQHYIVTPNPDFLLKARKDKEFREILNEADLSLPDGVGLIFASRFLGEPLKKRITGLDLIENCKAKILNCRVFLLGGFNGAAKKIADTWPAAVGYGEDIDGMELFAQIRECQPNILFVALGAPKQEKWIVENLVKIPSVKVAIGVGSAFNLISGQIKRAPKIFRTLGLEWFWRLFLEPWRWRKVWQSIIIFSMAVIKERL